MIRENEHLEDEEDSISSKDETQIEDAGASSDFLDPQTDNELLIEGSSQKPEIEPSRIDLNALWVVRRLRAKGFEAYLTGGCVRDLLLGKQPKDFDVATSATPEQVKSIFRNCRLIGRRFLLAHVVFPGGKIIETATFRAKPILENPEEPAEDLLMMQDNVYGSIQDDAFRRDLTVNGLFYDPVAGKVIDYVGGCEDLKNKIIRTIGDPEIRLQEDPVRILRAIKFAMRLGFHIEESTLLAMKKFSKELLRCAPARLQEELLRLLTSGHAQQSMEMCRAVGILDALMPELMTTFLADEQGSEESNPQMDQEVLSYWHGMLRAFDQVLARGVSVESSVSFAVLLLPSYQKLESSKHNERNWIDKLCVSWAERIRLTRRDQDRLRLLLSAIHLFSPDRVLQKSAQYLVRKPWFKEALLMFIVYLMANEQSLEVIKLWKVIAAEAKKPYKQDLFKVRKSPFRFRRKHVPMRGKMRSRRFRQPQ